MQCSRVISRGPLIATAALGRLSRLGVAPRDVAQAAAAPLLALLAISPARIDQRDRRALLQRHHRARRQHRRGRPATDAMLRRMRRSRSATAPTRCLRAQSSRVAARPPAPALAAVGRRSRDRDVRRLCVYYKARLLDAIGRTDETREWYQKALARDDQPAAEGDHPAPPDVRRRNRRERRRAWSSWRRHARRISGTARRSRSAFSISTNEATELYQISGEGTERFRQHLRVAQWAHQGATTPPRRRTQAWQAVQAATLERDRNYALSLLVEAHTLDKSLPKLLDQLAQQKTLTPEEQSVRIDLLRQTGQYQKAIDLFRSAHGAELNPELRLELLRMYRDAGQDVAMVAEYRQLIAQRADASPSGPRA